MADSAIELVASDPLRARSLAMTAAARARRSSDQLALHAALDAQRRVSYIRGEHEQLFSTTMEALRLAQDLHDERLIGEDHGWLAKALTELHQPEKAQQHAERAMDHLRAAGDSAALAMGLCELGRACLPVDQHGEAILHVREAENIFIALHDSAGLASAGQLLGEVLIDQRRWPDALAVLLKADRYIGLHGSALERCRLQRQLALCQAGMAQWDNVAARLHKADSLAQAAKAARELPELFRLRMRLLEAMGDGPGALKIAKRLLDLNDSLAGREVSARIAAMSMAHDATAQEEDLERLRAENDHQRLELADQEARGRWWMLATLILLGAGAVGLRQWRFNRRARRMVRERDRRIRELDEEVHARNMELERQHHRLAEAMLNDEDKEVRLKEIHHRVKNNLQVVNTLLKMQAMHLNDVRLDEAFTEAQGRIRSMALVHEHIYKVGDLSRVNVKAHVLALAEGVLANFGLQDRVKLDLHITYDRSGVETLIPLSLLLNELLTNSAKHAFGGRAHGSIHIALRRLPEGRCELTYRDDGAGMRPDQVHEGTSFGMELVRTLAEQLNGTIRLLKGEGTTFELTFDPEERQLRAAS